jgi:hypothetical protein
MISISLLGCKKDRAKSFETLGLKGFIYSDGNPAVITGGLGWYFAESRIAEWKAFPLKESQLSAEFKNITVADSIAVTVSLEETKTPVSCDCVAGAYFYYNILSIKKR